MNVRKMGSGGVWGWKWMSVVLSLSLVAQPVALSPLSRHTEEPRRERSVVEISDIHLYNVVPLCQPTNTGERLRTYKDERGAEWEIQNPFEIVGCLSTTCAESSAIFENKRCECRERLQEHWSKVRKLNSTGPFDRFGLVLVPGSCTHVVTQFDEDQ